jgi:hypothetical protein
MGAGQKETKEATAVPLARNPQRSHGMHRQEPRARSVVISTAAPAYLGRKRRTVDVMSSTRVFGKV